MANADSAWTIYNGLFTVEFRNKSHRYYINGRPQPGVTSILSKVLAKPELMLWPLNMALKHLTPLLPTVTEDDLENARLAHIKRRDSGSDVGTIVHELAEKLLSGNFDWADLPEDIPIEAIQAMQGLESWYETVKPETLAVEQVIYSHNNPVMPYAGTFDSILRIDGKNYLTDLKTTNAGKDAPQGIYADYFIQLGAYYMAYEEQRQHEQLSGTSDLFEIDDLMVLSCKKDGKVDTITASQVGVTPQDCAQLWSSILHLYKHTKNIKARIKQGVKSE